MAEQRAAAGGEETRRLVSKLKEVRQQNEGLPADQKRQDLMRALQEELAGLSEEEGSRRVEQAREQLVAETRDREQALDAVQSEVKRLKAEVEVVKAAREVLQRENEKLREDHRQAPVTGGGEVLVTMREGLRKLVEGQTVTPEQLGLPASEARLFRLTQDLIGFALSCAVDFDQYRMRELDQGGSIAVAMLEQQIRKRFHACLDDKSGSIRDLSEVLQRTRAFVGLLIESYDHAVREGVSGLLDELDPEKILEQHKGKFMTNWEEAWRTFERTRNDIANLTPTDRWEHFFRSAYRDRLGRGTGS